MRVIHHAAPALLSRGFAPTIVSVVSHLSHRGGHGGEDGRDEETGERKGRRRGGWRCKETEGGGNDVRRR